MSGSQNGLSQSRRSQRPLAVTELALDDPSADVRLASGLSGPMSCALVQLTAAQAKDVRALSKEATRFFRLPPARKRPCCASVQLSSVGPTAVLQGYREPNGAKELLRLFAGCRSPTSLPLSLRRLAQRVSNVLDDLLTCCLRSILRSVGGRHLSRRAVRGLVRANKVLDLFAYHNSEPSLQNCEEHIDRGLLHAIVASPIDGLQLRSVDDGAPSMRWLCPDRTQSCPDDVVPILMTGPPRMVDGMLRRRSGRSSCLMRAY